ncbi:hypothetical protein Baya_6290 [Bagarius yarrelli]|uniref:Shieldin complex subunit 3 n=1 Tax=Bagarius yarrelli TaxID=175774 RepID=A0A556TXJ7_BAGYA|nr:hypothetical protein Baya_6290 [Bagarius yarrelli]
MDVCLYYKSDKDKLDDLVCVSEKVLEKFPHRVLPVFTPWFPSGTERSCPIKPKNPPPVILSNQENTSECSPQHLKWVFASGLCTDVQEESVVTSKRKLITIPTSGEQHTRNDLENVAKKSKRTWSVYSPKQKTSPRTHYTISRQLHKTLQKYGLDLHQRAKWIISELNCAPQNIEEVWTKISHAINHAKLPTCNANFQRKLVQIWVYCDLSYCEYIGNFLRENFQLSGELILSVHNLGDIFKL